MSETENDPLTREEFEAAVKDLKNGKSPGADGIPVEVWKHSTGAREVLFEFLQDVWNKEEMTENLIVLCIFVIIQNRNNRTTTVQNTEQ